MKSISKLIRDDLQGFAEYRSAEKENAEGDGNKSGRIWLNANELPWSVVESVPENTHLNRYPEQQPAELLELLAKNYGVSTDHLLLSRGSDDAIDLLVRLFCNPKLDSVMICPPTFGMYEVAVKIQGANLFSVPLIRSQDFQLDLTKILEAWRSHIKIIFINSPNNPTGNLISVDDIAVLCKTLSGKAIIVVDEAYIEFAEAESAIKLLDKYENMVVLRTLSKAYGLAGARCGITFSSHEVVTWLRKVMPPYPLASLTIDAVIKTFEPENIARINAYIKTVEAERDKLYEAFKEIPSITKVWPSRANFILVETFNVEKFIDYCVKQGIIVRNVSHHESLTNCVRISIGTPEQNAQLLDILKKMP
ncbi:MAG: histidinol-phosphate transaminase [Gammaproteobacteria bacterium]